MTFLITEESLATAGLTVTTDRALAFIRDVERAHDQIRADGDDWANHHGNFPWRVADEAIGEDRSFLELAALYDDLGLADRAINDEFYCASVHGVMLAGLREFTTELVKIAIEWEYELVTIVRQKE